MFPLILLIASKCKNYCKVFTFQQGGGVAKSAKKDKDGSNLYKPPTVDELNTLRETQMLYHSNLFRMQVGNFH